VACLYTATLAWNLTGVDKYERELEQERQQDWSTSGPPRSSDSGFYFHGCNEARAAGAAPIYRDQPGYRVEIDGDGQLDRRQRVAAGSPGFVFP